MPFATKVNLGLGNKGKNSLHFEFSEKIDVLQFKFPSQRQEWGQYWGKCR